MSFLRGKSSKTKRPQQREPEGIARFLGPKEKQRTSQKRDALDPIQRSAGCRGPVMRLRFLKDS